MSTVELTLALILLGAADAWLRTTGDPDSGDWWRVAGAYSDLYEGLARELRRPDYS